ncbi:UNVERIFIED_CONTAM: hypothetical protein Scaly_1934200 [Sesamum calycinum]|uniref:Ty1-copia retrotransposon protein n=1 Tax=Sesamum calycinum TaxID=2727403 RepID=A0AAW2NJG8_9LAMI
MSRTLPELSKVEPLDGTNFKCWFQKLLIYFEQLEVDYVLFTDSPEITPQTTEASIAIVTTSQTATTNSGRTNSRYGGDDAGRKKYVFGKWLQFQSVDGKPIMDQAHEYENLVADVLNEDMKMCEILQADILLGKFPPSWNDYRNHLKHKKRDPTLQELVSHMRIEEANQLKDKEISNSSFSIMANLVEPSKSSKDIFQHKGKKFKKGVQQKSHKGNGEKIQKNKCPCYCCGKTDHKSY